MWTGNSLFVLLSPLITAIVGQGATLQPPYATPTFASPSSNDWPSASEWQSLNDSVGGRLQALRPWAAVCYSSDPSFNMGECDDVVSGYDNDTAREQAASALLWPNWESCGYDQGCALNYSNPQVVDGATCYQGTTPPYSIAIESAQDASTVVQWAVANKVKLTVKNTGHDFMGRSAAPGTLQVNMHQMTTLEYASDFVPQGSNAPPVPALTMAAGAQLTNIYAFAEEIGISVVLGACLTVGAAGLLQGGGHGLLSPAFGLGADHILEVEIVTADGQIRRVNAGQDSDLFWAVSGGGAGSWGIITSITVQAFPTMEVSASLLTIQPNTTQNTTAFAIEFIALVGTYQNEWINNGIVTAFLPSEEQYYLSLYWPTQSAPLSTLFPFFEQLSLLSANYIVVSNTTAAPMFSSLSQAIIQNVGPLADTFNLYGASTVMSSRLIPQSFFSSAESAANIAEAIWAGNQMVNAVLAQAGGGTFGIVPPVIFGDLPAGTRSNVNNTGANPALYQATWHVMFRPAWTVGMSQETYDALISAVGDATGPLTAMGITASYQNEGSPFEDDWQQSFFGYKYSSLSAIKQKYDPNNCAFSFFLRFITSRRLYCFLTLLPGKVFTTYKAQSNELVKRVDLRLLFVKMCRVWARWRKFAYNIPERGS
ncbi:hypothetical protein F5I97DRAFT_2072648 [Phlebopus sp. FC_14]|nr:hypothetical protein F5I97DRAFT_2072648 [Phlebopus sp. FC_14]